MPGHLEHDGLGHLLDGLGHVAVEGVEALVLEGRVARRAAHDLLEGRREAVRRRPVVGEVLHVLPQRAVVVDADHLHDPVHVLGLAVGRHAHELVLALVDLEAAVGGEGAVEQADGVREAHLLEHLELRAAAHAHGGGGPLARAVEGEHRRLLEGRAVEARRRVAHVVVREQQLAPGDAQLLEDQAAYPELLLHPGQHGLAEDLHAAREGREGREQQALELDEGLLVEHHVVDLLDRDARLAQAEGDGLLGVARVVLAAGEALLLGRRDDHAVLDQRRRAVVVVEREAEDVHQSCLRASSSVSLTEDQSR